ncbi:MAG: hypothetical protein GKR95_21455 [Gammaproteobacteria bacterium]|nr:hypothetical protein [Gammaproteobacteria bacterium]
MYFPSRIDGSPLRTKRLPNGRRELTAELMVEVDGEKITVPAGFRTDFSSYPRILLVVLLVIVVLAIDHCYPTVHYEYLLFFLILLIPHFTRVDIAGVVHDYLYDIGDQSKWQADKI